MIVFLGLALAATAMFALHSAYILPLIIFALRLFGQGMCSHLAVVAMSRWFVANRGRALSLANLGFSCGEAFLPLICVALMAHVAWYKLWLIAALLSVLAAPLLWWLLRDERTPQALAQENISVGMCGRHWTRKEAVRHPLFWFMIPSLIGPSAFGTAFFFHQVHYSEIKGWDHIYFVSFLPLYTVGSVLAMLLSGWALDKFGTPKLFPIYQLPASLAFILFALCSDVSLLLIGLLLSAMTFGANATLPNAFWAEFYGTENLGALKALAAALMVLGSAVGPGLGSGVGLAVGSAEGSGDGERSRGGGAGQPVAVAIGALDLLRPGDLIFFGAKRRCTHVGIYLGGGRYRHSSGRENGRNGIGVDSLHLADHHPVASHYRVELRGAGRVMRCHDGTPLS